MVCAENAAPGPVCEACRSLRLSGVFPSSDDYRAETAQNHHPAQNGRQLFLMLGFNAERYATDRHGLPIRARDRDDERCDSENQNHEANPE